jgi:hypothetical protein
MHVLPTGDLPDATDCGKLRRIGVALDAVRFAVARPPCWRLVDGTGHLCYRPIDAGGAWDTPIEKTKLVIVIPFRGNR